MTSPRGSAELRELILPVNANHHGTLFAGQGLQMLAVDADGRPIAIDRTSLESESTT